MDWHRQVDAYCERVGPAFWAEPVNALTNLSFILAALWGVRAIRRHGPRDIAAWWLVLLVVAVGVGSFLFHTVATVWAAVADVVPITLFIVSYLVLTIRRYFEAAWWRAALVGLAFLPAAEALGRVVAGAAGDGLNGSEGYLPALAALVVCGVWLGRRRHPAGAALLVAAGVFAVSLTFRTLDDALCARFPLGTHFLWHILNGVLLGWLLVTFARHGRPYRLSAA